MALVVLAIYLLTLAPGVSFWDAGEFIVAARTLGIPHPPGTPLVVLLANVWGRVLPLAGFAWRINLLSAVCSSLAAACWFLLVHDIVWRVHDDVDPSARQPLSVLAGITAALLASCAFSVWQNAVETEVYAGATLIIALIAWLAMRWRRCRDTPAGDRIMLLALWLGALGSAYHPMALLAGPPLVATLWVEASRRRFDRAGTARVAGVASAWVILIAVALGNVSLAALGVAALIAAIVYLVRTEQAAFGMVAVLILVAGIALQLFLLLRAQQHPWLDQGDPSTWHALLDVLRRATYPPRTPFDNPTIVHGPGNPGRSLTVLFYQLANYVQYLDWQWAASLGDLSRFSPPRLAVTLLMAAIGVRGAFAHRRGDPVSFVLVGWMFLAAGPLLLLYLNFKPGPSIGWNIWPHWPDHEVRDRDYFFVASFIAWAIWIAVGVADLVRSWAPRLRAGHRDRIAVLFGLGLVPLVLNYRAADQRHGPGRSFARDYSHALLASVPVNGILFTWGDNDTFPLWYAQQVEHLRRDVTVVCLPLGAATWYIDNLRRDDPGLTTLTYGVAPDDVVANVVRNNRGRRPIAWSTTASDALAGYAPQLVQQGLALVLPLRPVDPVGLVHGAGASPDGVALDLAATRRLIAGWNFGTLEADGDGALDGNLRALAEYVAEPMRQAGAALLARHDTAAALPLLRRAERIAPGDSISTPP